MRMHGWVILGALMTLLTAMVASEAPRAAQQGGYAT